MATQQEWDTRLSAIGDLRSVMAYLNITDPNMEAYKQSLIAADNVIQLQALEAAWIIVDQQIQSLEQKRLRKAAGFAARKICSEALDLIAGWNLSRGLTGAQIDQMVTDYSDVLLALQNNRPDTAKALVQAKVADGILVTQGMLDEIIVELTA